MNNRPDRREAITVKGKTVLICRAPTCEVVIPDSDTAGVETGYCSEACHLDNIDADEGEED